MNSVAAMEARVRQRAFRPAPKRSFPDWADEEVTLAPTEGGGAGKWRTDFMPGLREIMEAMGDDTTERVVILKPAQRGITVASTLLTLYHMAESPTTMMVVQPSESLAQAWSTARFTPNMLSTRATAGLIQETGAGGARYAGNTQTFKAFPGGYIVVAWFSSDTQMRSRPAQVVVGDEVDAAEATKEGDPIKRMERATITFGDRRKVILISTPTLKGYSRIEREYEQSSQGKLHVRCPDCQALQWARWENVVYDKALAKTDVDLAAEGARYACEHCGALWDQSRAVAAARAGVMVHVYPQRSTKGFHPGILSPFVTLQSMVKEFVEAHHNPDKLQVFINLKLGEVWEDRGDEGVIGGFLSRPKFATGMVDATALLPPAVGILTSFSDVQKDRIETLIMGHGGTAGDELFPIEHHIIQRTTNDASPREGDTEDAERVYRELKSLHDRTWMHPSGVRLMLRAKLVDVGYQEAEVLRYVKPNEGRAVSGVRGKGRKRPLAPMVSRKPSRNNEQAARVWEVNTDKTKDVVLRQLRVQTPGSGYIHCPDWFDQEHLDQLANSERKVAKRVGGEMKLAYKKLRERNEMLDLFCGNLVARQPFVCGLTREQIGQLSISLSAKAAAKAVEPVLVAASDHEVSLEPVLQPRAQKSIIRPRRDGGWNARWRNE